MSSRTSASASSTPHGDDAPPSRSRWSYQGGCCSHDTTGAGAASSDDDDGDEYEYDDRQRRPVADQYCAARRRTNGERSTPLPRA